MKIISKIKSPRVFIANLVAVNVVILAASILTLAIIRDGQVDETFQINAISLRSERARINCIAELADGSFFVAGGFTTISGGITSSIAKLNADGTFDPSFRGRTENLVEKVFPLNDGKILISGDFQSYDGVARNRIARINADGSLDTTFNPNFGTTFVKIVTVQSDGRIIVMGTFTAINGVPKNRVARLFPDGSLDLTFDGGTGPNQAGVNSSIVLPDGKILFAGNFVSYDGVPRCGVLRLNSNGSLDTGFVPNNACGSGDFYDMSVAPDGKVYVAGDNFGEILRLNLNGTTDATFNTGSVDASGGRIYSVLAQPDGKVIMGGDFDAVFINGSIHLRHGLFRFNENGSVDNSFAAEAEGAAVRAFALTSENKILLGGNFAELNGRTRGGIGRLNLDSSLDTSFAGFVGWQEYVDAFYCYPDGKILIAGGFDAVGSSFHRYVARLNADGTPDETFQLDPAVDNRINSFAVRDDGKVLLGGNSGSFGSLSKGLWLVNPDGSLDQSFDARLDSFASVNVITIQPDGKVLIGGQFLNVNGIPRRAIARLNANGSVDTAFTPEIGGSWVRAIALQSDGKIVIGGLFTTVNGSSSRNIARLDADGSLDTTFAIGIGADDTVHSLLLDPDNNVYVGGQFRFFSGQSRLSLVRLRPSGQIDTAFNPTRLSAQVQSIALFPQNKIIVGGESNSQVDAAPRQKIIRLLQDGSVDYSLDVNSVTNGTFTPRVFHVGVQADGKILASGQISHVNGSPRFGIARLNTFPEPIHTNSDYDGDGKSDISLFRPSNTVWYRRKSYVNQFRAVQFGSPNDRIVPADYDGDFITDVAVYRPSEGVWYILKSSDGTVIYEVFGTSEDLPAPADYDGDEQSDICVFRPSSGTWYRLNSSNGEFVGIKFGTIGDRPTLGDFDGDSKSDIAVFRPSTGAWYQINSSNGTFFGEQFGISTDKIAPADYDGDGKTDIAIYRPSDGLWYIKNSATTTYTPYVFGLAEDIPAPGDFDGDGKADIAVFRPSDGTWYIVNSSNSSYTIYQFGQFGDKPTHSAFGN